MIGLAEDYDSGFLTSAIYRMHYSKTGIYYKLWDYVASCLEKNDKILDLGCGPGQFSEMLFDRGFRNYVGIDFSPVAINMAKGRVPSFTFINCDLDNVDYSKYEGFKFVSLECFEHLKNDLQLLEKLPKKSKLIFSVPNYYAKYHVRVFNEKFIKKYYGNVLNLGRIGFFTGPPVTGKGKIFVIEAEVVGV